MQIMDILRVHVVVMALVALLGVCHCAPAMQERHVELVDPELTAGYFEGDMVLDNSRNGLRNKSLHWPDKIVYYKFSDHFDAEHLNHIRRGMAIIESASCIRFEEASANQRYYVNITGMDGGCYSSVGWLNRVQTYNLEIYPLDQGCFRLGTVVHEFLHTLGFYHMQSAANRDDFVYIAEENIRQGTENNFYKYDDTVVDNYDEAYDYASVLHYSAYAFSANGKKTIVALQEGEEADNMGQRRGMTQKDINKLNTMYRCPINV